MLRRIITGRAGASGRNAAVGICLDRAVAVAAASQNPEMPGRVQLAALPTEQDAQARTLGKLVNKLGMHGCDASLTLPLGSYKMLQMERPGVEDEELIDAVRFRLKDQLDYPAADAALQVFDAPHPGDRGRASYVNVVAVPMRLVREHTVLLKKAGLQPRKITIAELALRELSMTRAGLDEPIATVFLNTRQGVIQVTRGRELFLSRRIDYGLGSIKTVDAEATGIHMQLPLELRRTIDYFESNFSIGHIRQVCAFPADPMFSNLMQQASEFIGYRVEPLELPADLVEEEGRNLGFGLPEAYLAVASAIGISGTENRREVG